MLRIKKKRLDLQYDHDDESSDGRSEGEEMVTNGEVLRDSGKIPKYSDSYRVCLNGPIRAMSKKKAMVKQKPHVATRIRVMVKNEMFREVKFISDDLMFKTAFAKIIEREKVPTMKQKDFAAVYKTTFMEALNTKRSTCEQSARKIVYRTLAKSEKLNTKNFYTIEELSKLRSAATEREKEAFLWFIGEFVESVTGRRTWGKMKFSQTASQAKDPANGKLVVTVSDEALALLLFDNYSTKWFAQYDDLQNKGRSWDNRPPDEKMKRGTGKFTYKKMGKVSMVVGVRRELHNTIVFGTWLNDVDNFLMQKE